MSAFTESAFVKKLLELNVSQQSIQTLSLWLVHHRKHNVNIVRTWYREIIKAPVNRKLTYMYLANDVIQISKKKGPEYGEEFEKVLKKVFAHIGELCRHEEKTIGVLGRTLNIWEERGVYKKELIEEFRNALNRESKTTDSNGNTADAKSKTDASANGNTEKRHRDRSRSSDRKRQRSSKSRDEPAAVVIEVPSQFVLSPRLPAVDAPDHAEFIRAITKMENSASGDVVTREAIANFPPEVSTISLLTKLEDKESAAQLLAKVNEACNLLHDYNTRLATELDDRKTLQAMLKAYQNEQKDLLAQAEQRMEEYTTKLFKIKDVQREIQNHLKNLPDLTQLPDVTAGLAPLPSAGDLFNAH